MRICEDGIIRDMTPEEVAALQIDEVATLTPEEEIAEIQTELTKLQERLASLLG